MKRVYALYRVSTTKQVDHVTCGNTTKDDIPMQRIACHNFAERQQDWEITYQSLLEGGSASNRACVLPRVISQADLYA